MSEGTERDAEIIAAMARLMRERDEARADVARLRATVRRLAGLLCDGDVCAVCGAWVGDGREHAAGCAVGDALTEAGR